MKTAVGINLSNGGSTGTIMCGIFSALDGKVKTYRAYPEASINVPSSKNDIILIKTFFCKVNAKLAYYTGFIGCFALFSTLRFVSRLKKIKPEILHLHNLHNSYINLPVLFRFIKKNNIKVIWTLHDCWAFTGKCPYFVASGCEKWKTTCKGCVQHRAYPPSMWDTSALLYKLKKKWFLNVKDLTIVTPSAWLGKLVKESFLKDYDVKVINNGINLDAFKPTEGDFKEKHSIQGKKIILGVAMPWSKRKGLDVFVELSKRISDDSKIVLVGLSKEQIAGLPENIIGIERTKDQTELAKIYTAADVFVNPTREDNFPTVNIEALACGTPVITFDTGGSGEIADQNSGAVVPCDDIDALEKEINRVLMDFPYTKEACINRAKNFDMYEKFKEYNALYNESPLSK